MTQIKGILFDCDGVLLDTDTPFRRNLSLALAKFGYNITTKQAVDRWKGKNIEQVARELFFEGCDFTEQLVTPDFMKSIGVKADESAIVKNVRAMLSAIDLPKGVCSNGRTERLLDNFTTTNLLNEFEFICGRDTIGAMKPDPQVYLNGAEKLGFDISECLVVEDSVSGLSAGIESGAITVAFTGCGGKKKDLEKLNPNFIINDMADLPKIIEKLNGIII
jgi:HAD superfamily hydrolase (TIGR01509 family)